MPTSGAECAPGGGLITAEPIRVAAVIIAHNGESFIQDAIRSVCDQTRPVDEIVVVDDGSTDSTADLVRRHPGVRLVTQPQQRPSAARNRGVMETEAELIAFLDCDDMWLPQKTAAQLAIFETRPDSVAVSGGQIRLDEVRQQRRPERFPGRGRRGSIGALVSWNTVGNPSMVMVRRKAFEEAGRFDPSLHYGEDWELWLRMARIGPIEFVEEPVAVYRWHPDNLTHRTEVRQPGWNRRFQLDSIRLVPAWRRPLHLARAQSRYLLETTELAHRGRKSRPMRLLRGLAALLLDPLALTRRKATMVIRAVVEKPRVSPSEIIPPVAAEQRGLPSVSAVILTYNGEGFLPEAIESVLAQTRRPDEILVLDNGSTDRSAAIAGSYPGVRVVTLEENIGASGGYNRA
ncbi:MAG: glycosyltransferase, partial [Acidimicrobiia bacterium]|nr:glycosyltransferase [Acidimicrobiia bacterium]